MAEVGVAVAQRAEAFQKEATEASKKVFGSFSEIQKRGAGLWSLRMKAQSFKEVTNYAANTLKPDYVEKVNEHVKSMQKDRKQDRVNAQMFLHLCLGSAVFSGIFI